jgi:PEP-CTERM motif
VKTSPTLKLYLKQKQEQKEQTMNLKRTVAGLAITVAGFCLVLSASADPITTATAILDTPPGYNAAGGPGILTDGVISGDDWLSPVPSQILAWQDANYVPVDAGFDTGIPQPRLTFDLGGLYTVDAMKIDYIVDIPAGTLFANIRAPDELQISFSADGVAGPFGGTIVETGFDDSEDGNPTSGVGVARSLTVPLGGVNADAVRLDFFNDGEWTALSEISFQGVAVPEPGTMVLAGLGALGFLAVSRWRRR